MLGGRSVRLLYLASDAFGGVGGIARFNRDFAAALARCPQAGSIDIHPRRVPGTVEPLPQGVSQRHPAPLGKGGYAAAVTIRAMVDRPDIIICGHINLLPVAALAKRLATRAAQLVLVIHGIDVWTALRVHGLDAVDRVVSVSQFTLDAFRSWSGIAAERCVLLPNMVDVGIFTPGPKSPSLMQRYGLTGAPVIMGMGRLDAAERQKGFDEMLTVLPALMADHSGLKYLICGDGTDRARLEAKARSLGLAACVVFAGHVPEAEKADHYRLADAFVLCGRQEGFGIVLLEAMACGVPVVASCVDGSREAVHDGALGELADPDDPDTLIAAIKRALARPRAVVPAGLEAAFGRRVFNGQVATMFATWHATATSS